METPIKRVASGSGKGIPAAGLGTRSPSPFGDYNTERVHTSLGESPEGPSIENPPSPAANVVGLPRVGGLHHRYVWAEAA